MDLRIFLLVLASAFLHAMWNFAARKASGSLPVMWLGVCLASLLCMPVALTCFLRWSELLIGWPYILGTGLFHCFYFILLARCYEQGEISYVYPVARGTGVAGTALTAHVLIGENITWMGFSGICAIAGGILFLGLKSTGSLHSRNTGVLALSVGGCIVGYSLVDKLGVGTVHPVFYIFSMFFLTAFLCVPYVLHKHGWECIEAIRTSKRYIAVIGLGSMGTYLIILYTFRTGQVSYIVALREFAVVIGSVLGVVFLKEPLTWKKAAGIAAIVAGLVLLKLAN